MTILFFFFLLGTQSLGWAFYVPIFMSSTANWKDRIPAKKIQAHFSSGRLPKELHVAQELQVHCLNTLNKLLCLCGWSYRPQQVLIADEEPHNISCLFRLSFLCPLSQFARDSLMEEEVGSHDGCDGPQVHPVLLFLRDHLTEELQQSLKKTWVQIYVIDILAVSECIFFLLKLDAWRFNTLIPH